MEMTFEEFCTKKKIDAEKFRQAEPAYYQELKALFEQLHPDSFNMQKLFIINNIRRQYHLAEQPGTQSAQKKNKEDNSSQEKAEKPKTAAKPKVKPKIPPKKNKE